MPTPPYAHSPATPGGPWHGLREHSEAVAELAAGFARHFGSEGYARAAGLLHDLGKNAPDFQQLRLVDDAPVRIDHKHAGAIHAVQAFGRGAGLPLAFVITGHHGGLPDLTDLDGGGHLGNPAFRDRLAAILAMADDYPFRPAVERPTPPSFLSAAGSAEDRKRQFELWVRMLFSCLVDADWLDTEAHFDPARAAGRGAQPRTVVEAGLLDRFNAFMSKKATSAGTDGVNGVRAKVLADCRGRAGCPPGVFTLTAPTGAGKTLAGMGFALEHAVRHGLERVIVVIPYTSIIDQNAAVYREVFGADNVIDHHASLDPLTETQRNKLAAENWDAPIVVTTSVQFLESLFANRPAKCRKLHNVCNSVVVFDEVQTLPVGHLLPVVDVLKELVANYRVSLVLSTATQPALRHRESGGRVRFDGFQGMTEVLGRPEQVAEVFAALRRVGPVRWPASFDPPADAAAAWDALAAEVRQLDEVLVVTHQRNDARELAGRLEVSGGLMHLSARMCPRHRLAVIGRIQQHLAANRVRRAARQPVEPLRVVTTQLVEAGVDLDFPVVYRAFGGLDSIAQAAGRCNREGLLGAGGGEVRVFVAPTDPPPGVPQHGRDAAREMVGDDRQEGRELDPLDPGRYDEFFRTLYHKAGKLDKQDVQSDREYCRFATVAEKLRVIDPDGQDPVVVPFGEAGRGAIAALRAAATRDTFRGVQPFVVTARNVQALVDAGAADWLHDEAVAVLRESHSGLYHPVYGLKAEPPYPANPGANIC